MVRCPWLSDSRLFVRGKSFKDPLNQLPRRIAENDTWVIRMALAAFGWEVNTTFAIDYPRHVSQVFSGDLIHNQGKDTRDSEVCQADLAPGGLELAG